MIKIKNLKDLKDVAKTMTKEEFLKSDYVLSDNNGICPNFIGLLNRDCDNGNDNKYECVKCTIKAIEDNNIKFKDNTKERNESINIKVDVNGLDKFKNEVKHRVQDKILTLQAENLKLKNIIKELIKLNNNMTNQLKMGDDIID